MEGALGNGAAPSHPYTSPGMDTSTEYPSMDRKKRLTIGLINANLKTESEGPANKISRRFFYRQRLAKPNKIGPPPANGPQVSFEHTLPPSHGAYMRKGGYPCQPRFCVYCLLS